MTEIFEYMTAPTGTVHLVRQDRPDALITLCGLWTGDMMLGDETASGEEATCRRCKASLPKAGRLSTGQLTKLAEGRVRCACGCKHWEHGRCVGCGAPVTVYLDEYGRAKKEL